ncbi:trypsin-like serine protease [Streptomyces sp. NPDC047081]|uniref:S1 family peptidase n=1 Tax=Streptomyces sp. NPDC047081 TaxID=3154706 RepID=UPI0033F82A34
MRLRSLLATVAVAASLAVAGSTALVSPAVAAELADDGEVLALPQTSGDDSESPAVVNGEAATSASGMGALLLDDEFRCSASLVAAEWVLTAKHCVLDIEGDGAKLSADRLSVRVKSLDRTSGGGVVNVEYTKVRTSHDIALLHLTRSANAEYVRLPTKNPAVGTTNYIFGWGSTNGYSGASTYLKRATVEVTDTDAVDYYGGQAIRSYKINGYACYGDSGGPQFKLVDGLRYQVGVLSTVTSSGGVCQGYQTYASVPASLDWINEVAGL